MAQVACSQRVGSDVFAISTYFTVSAVFFYIGLIPDFAIVRDHNKGIISKVYDLLAEEGEKQKPLRACCTPM